jgi:hypothetical protein
MASNCEGKEAVIDLHHVRVVSPDARGVMTRLYIDGEEMRGVSAVSWEVGVDKEARVTIILYADVEFDGEAKIVKRWRTAHQEEGTT